VRPAGAKADLPAAFRSPICIVEATMTLDVVQADRSSTATEHRSIDIAELPGAFGHRVPRRTIGVFSLLFASLLAVARLEDIGSRTLSFGQASDQGERRGEQRHDPR